MKEIFKLIGELKDKIPPSHKGRLRLDLIESLTIASNDVVKLINNQDFEGVQNRVKKLNNEQMAIRADYIINQFPSGGTHSI
tara:strand:+ start:307 stop:552 length:246 start_codon:yes stop_codon:yes gene_type:complete